MEISEVHDPLIKSQICENLLRSLPQWFGIESAIKNYIDEVRTLETWAAKTEDRVVGFISVKKTGLSTAEIHVMAVTNKHHRQKIGQNLLKQVEESLRKQGIQFLQVKTLGASRPNEEYDRTRNFYLSNGFTPVEEFKTLWGKENPCLQLIKSLSLPQSLLSHIELNVSNYAKSIRFYDMILIPLGWKKLVCQKDFTSYTDGTCKIIISPTEENFIEHGFHRKRTGVNHVALYAHSAESIDHFYENILRKHQVECLYEKKPAGTSTYYTVLFEDPDRIKLEVVFSPNYCSVDHWTNQQPNNFDAYVDMA